MRATGIHGYWSNTATWYISATLIAMAVIFPLLRAKPNVFFNIIAPLGAAIITGFLSQTHQKLHNPYVWYRIAYTGLFRMFAALLLGCICYSISQHLSKYHFTNLSRLLFTVCELGFYIVAFLLMAFKSPGQIEFIILLFLWLAELITCSRVSFLPNICAGRCFQYLKNAPLALYFFHLVCAHYLKNNSFGLPYEKLFWVFMISAIIWSILSNFIVRIMVRKVSELWKHYRHLFIQPN